LEYEVLTIGHSIHAWDGFLAILRSKGVTAIADVRSAPYSRYAPQFNRDALAASLQAADIAYVPLGKELGGRPADQALFSDGVADYERMAATPRFAAGLDRIVSGAARYRIAVMCSEQDPLDCHRCLLVGRRLRERGVNVRHILADGTIESHHAIERQLLAMTRMSDDDLFMDSAQRLSQAYRERSRRVAFVEQAATIHESTAAE